jgi:hypothetical protein
LVRSDFVDPTDARKQKGQDDHHGPHDAAKKPASGRRICSASCRKSWATSGGRCPFTSIPQQSFEADTRTSVRARIGCSALDTGRITPQEKTIVMTLLFIASCPACRNRRYALPESGRRGNNGEIRKPVRVRNPPDDGLLEGQSTPMQVSGRVSSSSRPCRLTAVRPFRQISGTGRAS